MNIKKLVGGSLVSLSLIPSVFAQNSILDGISGFFTWLFEKEFTVAGVDYYLGYLIAVAVVFYAIIRALVGRTGLFRDNDNLANLLSIAMAIILTFIAPFSTYFRDLIEIGGWTGLFVLIIVVGIGVWTAVSVSHHEGRASRASAAEAGSTAMAGAALAKKQEEAARAEKAFAKEDLEALVINGILL